MIHPAHHRTPHPGSIVHGMDGERVGVLEECRDGWLRIREGHLFAKERVLPAAAIANYVEDEIYLSIPTHVALRIAREAPPPVGDTWYTAPDGYDLTASVTPIEPVTPHQPA